jgi:hypothetical protein
VLARRLSNAEYNYTIRDLTGRDLQPAREFPVDPANQAGPTGYADYFQAAWRFKHYAALGKPNATLTSLAAEAKVSPKYLPIVWETLQEPNTVDPVKKLQLMWRGLPAPAAKQPGLLQAKTAQMRDFVISIRQHTAMQFTAPLVSGLPAASQPLLNWKLRQFELNRRKSDPATLRNDTGPSPRRAPRPRISWTPRRSRPALGRPLRRRPRRRPRPHRPRS